MTAAGSASTRSEYVTNCRPANQRAYAGTANTLIHSASQRGQPRTCPATPRLGVLSRRAKCCIVAGSEGQSSVRPRRGSCSARSPSARIYGSIPQPLPRQRPSGRSHPVSRLVRSSIPAGTTGQGPELDYRGIRLQCCKVHVCTDRRNGVWFGFSFCKERRRLEPVNDAHADVGYAKSRLRRRETGRDPDPSPDGSVGRRRPTNPWRSRGPWVDTAAAGRTRRSRRQEHRQSRSRRVHSAKSHLEEVPDDFRNRGHHDPALRVWVEARCVTCEIRASCIRCRASLRRRRVLWGLSGWTMRGVLSGSTPMPIDDSQLHAWTPITPCGWRLILKHRRESNELIQIKLYQR